MSTHNPTVRALLRIAYDGTDFRGCGPLPGERTVVGELAAALDRVGLHPIEAEALSRTDSGVHARGNLAHVVLPRRVHALELLGMLERHLPDDLRCSAVHEVGSLPPIGAKTYTYTLDLSRWGDPFVARTAWRLPAAIDVEVLSGLAEACVGTHDFVAFRRSGETRSDLSRRVVEASWQVQPDLARFVITGEGFIYRLVRSLVGGMLLVARGSASKQDFRDALAGRVGPASQQTAPARGLCLEHIDVDLTR